MSGRSITKDVFGTTKDGQTVHRYTLQNCGGLVAQVITLGGCVTSLKVPDKHGKLDDVALGFDTVAEYEENLSFFGCLIGRTTNRIAKGEFTLDGVKYKLEGNDFDGVQHVHGGKNGIGRKMWSAEVDGQCLRLTHTSPHNTENFPGEVTIHVTYQLTDDNELQIDYSAATTQRTPVSLSDHGMYNLGGHKSGTILDHEVTVFADKYLPLEVIPMIPTGVVASVSGTQADLRTPIKFGDRAYELPGIKPGFTLTYITQEGDKQERKRVARVEHKESGRVFEAFTTLPCFVVYSGQYLDDTPGKDGAKYPQYGAFIVFPNHYPNALNEPSFPSIILNPDETYRHSTWYKFTATAPTAL